MFSAEEIQTRLRVKPFQPVRIIASEGLQYDIYHPDMVWVGRRDVSIGIPDQKSPTIYDGIIRVALVHIVALEDLPVKPTKSANGPPV